MHPLIRASERASRWVLLILSTRLKSKTRSSAKNSAFHSVFLCMAFGTKFPSRNVCWPGSVLCFKGQVGPSKRILREKKMQFENQTPPDETSEKLIRCLWTHIASWSIGFMSCLVKLFQSREHWRYWSLHQQCNLSSQQRRFKKIARIGREGKQKVAGSRILREMNISVLRNLGREKSHWLLSFTQQKQNCTHFLVKCFALFVACFISGIWHAGKGNVRFKWSQVQIQNLLCWGPRFAMQMHVLLQAFSLPQTGPKAGAKSESRQAVRRLPFLHSCGRLRLLVVGIREPPRLQDLFSKPRGISMHKVLKKGYFRVLGRIQNLGPSQT